MNIVYSSKAFMGNIPQRFEVESVIYASTGLPMGISAESHIHCSSHFCNIVRHHLRVHIAWLNVQGPVCSSICSCLNRVIQYCPCAKIIHLSRGFLLDDARAQSDKLALRKHTLPSHNKHFYPLDMAENANIPRNFTRHV